MSENARREREIAVAALESSPRVDESVVAPVPAPPKPEPPARSGPSAGTVVAGGGVLAALAAVDQALQAHGMTLADLTMRSGPLLGGLVANGWLVALGVWAAWWVAGKWQEDRRERVADREWARVRAAAQDAHARAQVRAIRAVAEEITAVRGDLAAQAARVDAFGSRVDRVEQDVRELRARMPESRGRSRALD